jgi:hypothetical protein
MGKSNSKSATTAHNPTTRGSNEHTASLTKEQRELVKYTVPTGLYKSVKWDRRAIKKLVLEKAIAPLYPGQADPISDDYEECPICMLYESFFSSSTNLGFNWTQVVPVLK